MQSDAAPDSSRQVANHRKHLYGSSLGFKGGKSQRFSSMSRPLPVLPSPYVREPHQ